MKRNLHCLLLLGGLCLMMSSHADLRKHESNKIEKKQKNEKHEIFNRNAHKKISTIDPLKKWGIHSIGYVDGSYNYLVRSNKFTSGLDNRAFDTKTNGGTLQQIGLIFSKQPKEGLGGLVNLTAGSDANVIAAYGLSPLNLAGELPLDLTQAFLQYAKGPFTLMAGKYVTLAGIEVINSINDMNFSRSILFQYATPYTHTGARLTYAVNNSVNLIAGINNGWDDFKDTNSAKTVEWGFAWTPNTTFSFNMDGYSGIERVNDLVATGPQGMRNLIDFYSTYHATETLSFAVNYDYGTQANNTFNDGTVGTAAWQGIAGYINYQFNDRWRASLRSEYYDDDDGYTTGVAQKWKEITGTLAYLPTRYLELRAETRRDFSNVNSFVDRDGIQLANNQQSFALEALLKL